MPGLGQFYCRQWGKGGGFLVAALAIDAGFGVSEGIRNVLQGALAGLPSPDSGAILLRSFPFLALAMWSIVDAAKTARSLAFPTSASNTGA